MSPQPAGPFSTNAMRAMSPARRSGDGGLHGSAPDDCPTALLIIDAINDFDYEEADGVLAEARPMATHIRRLASRARRAGVPIVYVNDNFGRWRSDFRRLVAHCARAGGRGRAVARALRPDPQDYFVLKPKHSGFYSTSLGLLLDHLGARILILTGLLADMCVLFTAHDAYMRGYRILVPADCVAARKPADRARALGLMRRALGADTRPSFRIDLGALAKTGGRPSGSG